MRKTKAIMKVRDRQVVKHRRFPKKGIIKASYKLVSDIYMEEFCVETKFKLVCETHL